MNIKTKVKYKIININILKMLNLSVMLLFVLILTGCMSSDKNNSAGNYAVIVKSENNLYNERLIEGYTDVIESANGNVLVRTPTDPSAEAQIRIVNSLIDEEVDCIAIAANSYLALQDTLQEAMDNGIKVVSFDSAVDKQSRMIHIEQVESWSIGYTLIEAASEIVSGEGQIAIISTTNQARNQEAWIESIRNHLERGDYPGLTLVKIAYGYDDYQISYETAINLISTYPDLELIIVPSAASMPAVAQAIVDNGKDSDVKITGLGLPSDMHPYIGKNKVCPIMFLWNPIDLGKLAAWASLALVSGDIEGSPGEVLKTLDMGNFNVVSESGSGSRIILREQPLFFDEDNMTDWIDVF